MSKSFVRFGAENEKAYFYISPDLCIEKCPSQVIDWSTRIGIYGTPIVEPKWMERCTGCKLCQYFCPDAAIDILRKKKEKEKEPLQAK